MTDALLMGGHRSRRVGAAIEFADFQDYVPGMDLRFLDWRVLARTDRLVVKRFETETEWPCTVVLDLSADLGEGQWPDLDGSRAGWALCAAATLITFLSRQGEPVGLEVVGGVDVLHRSIPPRTGRAHRHLLMATLAQLKPGGRADLAESLTAVGRRLRRRAWVALITDGMEEPGDWLPTLGALVKRGADLRVMHLCDPAELRLEFDASSRFFSPEGGPELSLDPVGAREAFKPIVAGYLSEIYRGVIAWGGRYSLVKTDAPIEDALGQLLSVEQRSLESMWP